VRPAIVAILIFACCRTAVGQSPLAIKWKTETPLSISSTDPIDAKVAIDLDGNILRVIHTGYTPQTTVSKFTLSGQKVFEKTWSTPQPNFNSFFLKTFSIDHEGNSILLILENSYSPSEGVVHYVSYDRNGTLRWDKTERIPYEANVPSFQAAAVDSQNNIIFAGTISNRLTAQKLSAAGDLVWRHSVDRPGATYSSATHVAVDATGRSHVTGFAATAAGDVPLLLTFDADTIGDFWGDPTPRHRLENIRITESGAIYVTDSSRIFRINASGQTEWSRSAESQYAPLTLARMAEEKIALITFEGFNILDKTGKSLGNGRLSGIRNARGQGDSLFLSKGSRVSQLRSEASLVSEFDFGEDTDVYDLAITPNSDIAFVGIKWPATGDRFLFAGALTHSVVPDAPRIVQQPQGAILPTGSDFSTSVGSSGANLNYQWFFEPSPLSRVALEGQTNSSLRLTNLSASQSGKYSVQVSNVLGNVFSAYAELAVHLIPKITSIPTATPSRPYVGDRVTWRVSASYSSPMWAQWFKDGAPIPRATNTTYSIPASSLDDIGNYSVLITNLVGQAKSDETAFPEFLHNVDVTVVTNELQFSFGNLGKDAQNHVYFCGAAYVSNKLTVLAAKFDSTGQVIWTNNVPSLSPILTGSLITASFAENGAILVPGVLNSTRVLCKIDPTGAIAWTANLQTNLSVFGSVQASELYSYVAGLRVTSQKKAFVLIALNPDGTHSHTTSIDFSGATSDPVSWLEVADVDRVYLASRALKGLYAISPTGDVLWTNSLSTNTLVDMKVGPGNSIYLVTQNARIGACSKYNAAGEMLWTTPLRRPGGLTTESTQLEVDPLGNAYVANSLAGAIPQASYVAKIAPGGQIQCEWSPMTQYPYRRHLQTTDAGVVYIIRYQGDLPSLAKYDADGVRRWSRTISGQSLTAAFLPVTPREIFVLTPRKLARFQDLETPEMEQITAQIQRGIVGTNPVLHVQMQGAAAQKTSWFLNSATTPTALGDSIIPKFSTATSYYSAEIETEDAILATADHRFDVFSIINGASSVDENLHLNIRTFSNFNFRLQRSQNLIDWEDYATPTSDANGTTELNIPVSSAEQTQYFRAVK
jgi:hypothetical protein